MTIAWLATIPVVAASALVVLVPGLVATSPLRIAWVSRLAISSLVGIACAGGAGVLFSLVGEPFAAWQVMVPAVPLAALALFVRSRLPVSAPRDTGIRWWWILAAGVGSGAVMTAVAFWDVPSPEQFSQTYDNVFHLGAVAQILTSGDASSLTLRTLIETERSWSFYPAGFHTLAVAVVQLTGASIPLAVNSVWLAVCFVVWLPGTAWFAQVLLRSFPPARVALVALPMAASFGAMPYAMLSWGTLYPTFLATALLPASVAVPLVLGEHRRRLPASALIPVAVGALTLVCCAMVFAQPRVAATWIVMLVPLILMRAYRAYAAARALGRVPRRRARMALIAVGVAAVLMGTALFVYLVVGLGLFERPLEDRLGGPQAQATQSVWAGLVQVALQAWPTGFAGTVSFPAVMLSVAVIIGVAVAWRSRSARWAVVSYFGLALLFALAAGSDDVLSKLATGLWYKDRYRLSSALVVIGIVLATIGVLSVTHRLQRRAERTPRAADLVAGLLAWVTALTAAASLVLTGASAAVGAVFQLPEDSAGGQVVSKRQIEFMEDAASAVPTDQRILGDPWDGSAWTLIFGAREPVFPHVTGQWDPDRLIVARHLTDIEAEPAVCEALDDLRVRYVLYDPHSFGGGDPIGNQFFAIHEAVESDLFVLVATDGTSALYRIDQCGPLE